MAIYEYPYTDFNEYNLDWIIKTVKDLSAVWAETQTEWGDVQTEWENYKNYIDNYFAQLDLSQEVSDKIDQMAADGYFSDLFNTLFRSDIITEAGTITSDWIASNLLQETGYVLDKSLTVQNAAADALAAGNAIKNSQVISNNIIDTSALISGYYINAGTGNPASATGWYITDYITIIPGNTYYLKNYGASSFGFYDIDKTFVDLRSDSDVCSNNQLKTTILIPSGIYYIRLSVAPGSEDYVWLSSDPYANRFATIKDFYRNRYLITSSGMSIIDGKYNNKLFIPGTYDATWNNSPYNSASNASANDFLYAYADLHIKADYQIYVSIFDDDLNYVSDTGWITEYDIARGTYYKITIKLAAADTLENIVDSVDVSYTSLDSVKERFMQSIIPSIIYQCRDGRVTSDVPPDSVFAIKMTADNQYDRIRFSVTKTVDNKYVAVHDTTINNLAVNMDGTPITTPINTSSLTLAQLNGYDWGQKFGAEYAGLQVPELEDCLKLASIYGLSVALDFKFTVNDTDIDDISLLLAKYNHLNAILISVSIPNMIKFKNKSPLFSYYFNGTYAQISANTYWLDQLKTDKNEVYVQYSPFGSEPDDSTIEICMNHGYRLYLTPIEGMADLTAVGFDSGINLYECHYIENIKTSVRKYADSFVHV